MMIKCPDTFKNDTKRRVVDKTMFSQKTLPSVAYISAAIEIQAHLNMMELVNSLEKRIYDLPPNSSLKKPAEELKSRLENANSIQDYIDILSSERKKSFSASHTIFNQKQKYLDSLNFNNPMMVGNLYNHYLEEFKKKINEPQAVAVFNSDHTLNIEIAIKIMQVAAWSATKKQRSSMSSSSDAHMDQHSTNEVSDWLIHAYDPILRKELNSIDNNTFNKMLKEVNDSDLKIKSCLEKKYNNIDIQILRKKYNSADYPETNNIDDVTLREYAIGSECAQYGTMQGYLLNTLEEYKPSAQPAKTVEDFIADFSISARYQR